MIHFDMLIGTGVSTPVLNRGNDIRIDIHDTELTESDCADTPGRVRNLQITGSQHDIRRLYYALGLALDDAEKQAPPVIAMNPIHPHINPPHLINAVECPCSFGAGKMDSACVACSGGHDPKNDRRE